MSNTINDTVFIFPKQKSVYKGKVREVYNINDEILVNISEIHKEKTAFNEPQLRLMMQEENITLKEVIINPKDNPANEIIRSAIKNKKENSEKTARFKSDFYSRGIIRLKDAPKTIMGQKFDFFDEILDSTRSGIIYLSETVSKITFQKPDKIKEVIVASKVSGKDNGFSFNNAASVNFDFYEKDYSWIINTMLL